MIAENVIQEWMIMWWNERCKEYEENCSNCLAWKCYDYLTKPDKADIPRFPQKEDK